MENNGPAFLTAAAGSASCRRAGTRQCKLNNEPQSASHFNVQPLLRHIQLPSLGSSPYQHIFSGPPADIRDGTC